MSADLDKSKGFTAFAFTGDRSEIWHRDGQQIDPAFKNDVEYLAKVSGTDFEVAKAALTYKYNDTEITVPNESALIRLDTGFKLGTVSNNRYNIEGLQPKNIIEFFKDFLADNSLEISTLGALRTGRIVWAQAKLGPEYDFIMPGDDKIDAYVRLQTSYDTTRSTSLVGCFTRQVCTNTEQMVEAETQGRQYVTKHSQVFNAEALQAAFGLLGESRRLTVECWNLLANTDVTDEEASDFFMDLLDMDKEDDENNSTRSRNQLIRLHYLFKNGPGSNLKAADSTAYGLLNAVTRYVDHERTARSVGGFESEIGARMSSALFGTGAALKLRARKLATELAQVIQGG